MSVAARELVQTLKQQVSEAETALAFSYNFKVVTTAKRRRRPTRQAVRACSTNQAADPCVSGDIDPSGGHRCCPAYLSCPDTRAFASSLTRSRISQASPVESVVVPLRARPLRASSRISKSTPGASAVASADATPSARPTRGKRQRGADVPSEAAPPKKQKKVLHLRWGVAMQDGRNLSAREFAREYPEEFHELYEDYEPLLSSESD
ncbi:hypothetical protein GGX14DRAFT_661274 [Mycena pura]|uniref:Uncharacterized protein n=1 Tax=Mycena pura TaxID=153505 RepID=A0AAD6V4S2_9AGAR|nr:hypothetical protein GGX14DRAFT_661274 [Mycena pura]